MRDSRTDNLLHALQARECVAAPPCAGVHAARRLCERVVPNQSALALQHPDCFISRFTDDGQHLVCFSRSLHDVLVYRYDGLDASERASGAEAAEGGAPARSAHFSSFFTHAYTATLAAGQGSLCRDFCVFLRGGAFAVFASSALAGAPPAGPALAAAPLLHSVTLHVLRIADGHVCDRHEFPDENMHLAQAACASAFDDLLTVVSWRHQTVHILRVTPDGALQTVMSVGTECQPGDDALLREHGGGAPAPAADADPTLASAPPLCGLRQRLLTFLFLEAQSLARGAAAGDAAARALPVQLFFRHVASYHALVLWRAHLLSATQLLLQFSFPDAAAPDAAHAPAFVALYDFVAARFVAFFNCASEEFLAALARVPHQFSPLASDTLWARCGYDHALEAFRRHQLLLGSRPACAARRVAPGVCAVLTPHSISLSPYLDHRLFQYDEKLVSPGERPRPSVDGVAVKFASRSRPNTVRFRLSTTLQAAAGDGRSKWVASFVFHPVQPFALSVLQSFVHPQQINAHFRWQ